MGGKLIVRYHPEPADYATQELALSANARARAIRELITQAVIKGKDAGPSARTLT